MATVAERLEIHPTTPQPRLLRAAAACLAGGGVIASHCDVWNDDATKVRVEWGGACADPTGQNGNLKVAPDFCPGDPDYRIASTSACAGAATDGSDLGWQPASCTGPVPTSVRAESWGRLKGRWR